MTEHSFTVDTRNPNKYSKWYQCHLDSLPALISTKFVQLGPDQETINFLDQSEKKSDWLFTQIWHSVVKLFLGVFMTQTSING
ncbi:protein-L-histidine N-pros-methyltransferase isoform X1 [Diabrotica virgifera virgifera]|nr:protein-L-histidine N-pros-methyltransferase isoform X1 [Diabrotica virgifera virgifera]